MNIHRHDDAMGGVAIGEDLGRYGAGVVVGGNGEAISSGAHGSHVEPIAKP